MGGRPIIKPEVLGERKKEVKECFARLAKSNLQSLLTELGINSDRPIREQTPNPLSDRKALDGVVFETLGSTPAERDEVYWAVCELVKARLEKASSVCCRVQLLRWFVCPNDSIE